MNYKELIDLDIGLLQPNPLQVRSLIKSESLVDLVESIKTHGILEPLVVAKTPAGYQIIAGERRWRAAKIVGLKKIPVVVRETTSRGMLEMALVENVQREELNPIERAQGLQRLIDEFALSLTEIAKRIGKSTAYVSNSIRLLALPDAIKDGMVSLEITEGHARAIAGLSDSKVMVDVYKTILFENASVRRTEELVRKTKEVINQGEPKEKRSLKDRNNDMMLSLEMEKLAKSLEEILAASVKIQQSKISGRITVTFKGAPESTSVKIKKFADNFLES